MTNIESRLRKLVAEHLGADEIEISDHTAFQDDLGADSMDRVELSMLIEDEFHIIVTDDEAEAAIGGDGTFGQLCELVAGKVAEVAHG